MIGRVVEIANDSAYLSLLRGFMIVSVDGAEIGRVAIKDIAALIVRGYGASISLNLCARLAQEGLPVVLCGGNQTPESLVWPIDGHFEQGRRMQAQAEAGRPLRKRLWRDLVKAKVTAQADILQAHGHPDSRLRQMAGYIRSGDESNIEGQAARYYWPRLMGEGFRRDRNAGGVNACLNYGYTVLRAGAARAILAAGLHPSLSVHHESRGDALRLADDLMEPFRPYIDNTVAGFARSCSEDGLDKETKAILAKTLTLDLTGPNGARPLQGCLDALALSLARIYTGVGTSLDLPQANLPLMLTSRDSS